MTVRVAVWKEELEKFEELTETWIQLRGLLLPKWCERSTLDQVVSAFGLLLDVDRQKMFHSLFEVIMVKIKCRDSSKIPNERLFELEGKMFRSELLWNYH